MSISKEEFAAYDSESNRSAEVCIGMIHGLFRTQKQCLETRISQTIPIKHPLVPWLMEHTAFLLNAVVRGDDGHTPWTGVRGRPFHKYMLGIPSSSRAKTPCTTQTATWANS